VYVIAESEKVDLETTSKEWLEPHASELFSNFTETAKVSGGSTFTFAVEKSSGETKTLDEIEEEQSASAVEETKTMFDPLLVYGLTGISSVFALLGVVVCIAVVCVTKRKKSETNKVHVAPEDNKVKEPADPKFTYTHLNSPNKIVVGAHRRSHRNL
jgi:hypothetical protein